MSNLTNALDDLPDGFQRATGQTVLWALVALALAAMTQSSRTAEYVGMHGKQISSEASPYRISPLFCLFDAIAELYLIGRSFFILARRQSSSDKVGTQAVKGDRGEEFTNDAERAHQDIEQQTSGVIESQGSVDPSQLSEPSTAELEVADIPSSAKVPDPSKTVTSPYSTTITTTSDQISPATETATDRPENDNDENRPQPTDLFTEEVVVPYATERFNVLIGKCVSAMQSASEVIPHKSSNIVSDNNADASEPASNTTVTVHNTTVSTGTIKLSIPFDDFISQCIDIVKSSGRSQIKPVKKRSSAIYCMKMSIFVLGALPQSIKLFAIQGVPCTQAMAATYLISIVLHGSREIIDNLTGSRPHDRAIKWSFKRPVWHLLNLAHWLASLLLWSGIISQLELPQVVPLAIVHNLPIPTSAFIGLTILIGFITALRTPCVPIQHRRLINHLPWAHAVSSPLLWVIMQREHERAAKEGIFTRMQLPGGHIMDLISEQFMFLIPLLALPILSCVMLAQMMRWSFLALSRFQAEHNVSEELHELLPVDERTKRAADVLQSFRELKQLVEEENWKKPESVAEFGHRRRTRSWWTYMREALGHLVTAVPSGVFPFAFLDKATAWLTNLHPEVKSTAFMMFAILTATLYYTLCFDNASTAQPSWTAVLG